MKKVLFFTVILFLMISFSGCANNHSEAKYEDLERMYEELSDEYTALDEELEYEEKGIELLFRHLKTLESNKKIPIYKFKDMWSVGDSFDLSFYYDKKDSVLCYKITDKEGTPITFIYEDTVQLQNLFIGVLRSDGCFESYNTYWDGETLFYLPDYNYSYEITLIADVNGTPHYATYKMSCEDIKNG